MNSSFGIVSVCLNITHTYVSQLAFNNGQNPNGTWNLIVRDVFIPTDTGSFHYINITFGLNPPADPASPGPCGTGNPGGCQCPDGISSDCDLFPDMTASALIIQSQHTEYPGHIAVANATPNIGWGPLEVRGIQSCFFNGAPVSCSTVTCPDGSTPKQLVNQRIYHRNGNTMTHYDHPAGTMSFHPTHNHFHIDDWSLFSLRVATPNPDARTWPIIGTGTKQSFCLINLGDCDSYPGYCVYTTGAIVYKTNVPNADFGVVSGCDSTQQGIRVANLDIYSEGLNYPGIILPSGICNEQYYIVSITDFNNNFIESDENNNWVKVPITLTHQLSNDHFQDAGFFYTLSGTRIDVFANAVSPDSMVWVWCDGTSSTTAGIITNHLYNSPGTYVVYSYAYNHCESSVMAEAISILPTGVNFPVETVVSFNTFANPSKGNIGLSYTISNKSGVLLEVFDQVGKLVKRMVNAEQLPGKYLYQFDPLAENLPAGVYVTRLSTDDKTMNLRMIVMQ